MQFVYDHKRLSWMVVQMHSASYSYKRAEKEEMLNSLQAMCIRMCVHAIWMYNVLLGAS